MASDPFNIRCSEAPFSEAELDILRRYGRELERLASGERAPATAAQERFVDAVRGKHPPETVYERVWTKYLMRLEWEKDPANRSAMGPRQRIPDDREDWKRMRGQFGAISGGGHRAWTSRIDDRGARRYQRGRRRSGRDPSVQSRSGKCLPAAECRVTTNPVTRTCVRQPHRQTHESAHRQLSAGRRPASVPRRSPCPRRGGHPTTSATLVRGLRQLACVSSHDAFPS